MSDASEPGEDDRATAESEVRSSDGQVNSEVDPKVDPEVLAAAQDHPVLLFDGVCNLCNRWIQWVIERDPDAVFRFAPLQSAVANELLEATDYRGDRLDSVVLIEEGEFYAKSDAVIRVAKHVGGIYRVLWPFRIVPRRVRNFFYDFVANRRYGWFGKRDQCMMPSPDVEERFLVRE